MCQEGALCILCLVQGPGDRPFSGRARRAERRLRASEQPNHEGRAVAEHRTVALSAREIDVLEELAKGTGTEQIALRLHVSPHTVRTHIKNIMRKLDARTRAHAVAIAYAEFAINPDLHSDN
jgi:DNA-binding CsgD family transcriptional regulator